MKPAPFLLLTILTLACVQPAVRAEDLPKGSAVASESPADVIRQFYRWYVGSIAANKEPRTEQRAEMRRYVTDRLLKQIERVANSPDGLDADYFLEAQDIDQEWTSHLTVSKVVIEDDRATADLTMGGHELGTKKLHLTLVRERSGWKIDKVRG